MTLIRSIAVVAVLSLAVVGQDKAAPAFTLSNLEGASVSLSQFRGNIAVIDFWAMWCKACREAFPELNKIQAENKDNGVVVLGVNLEKAPLDKVKGFTTKANIQYAVLLDPEMSTAKTFGIKGVPSLAVINRDGTVARLFRGLNKQTEKEIRDLIATLAAVK